MENKFINICSMFEKLHNCIKIHFDCLENNQLYLLVINETSLIIQRNATVMFNKETWQHWRRIARTEWVRTNNSVDTEFFVKFNFRRNCHPGRSQYSSFTVSNLLSKIFPAWSVPIICSSCYKFPLGNTIATHWSPSTSLNFRYFVILY